MGANECRSELAISSLEQEADSLPTLSSDTRQLSLLSGIDIAAKSCESEPPKDGSPGCTCGKATSDCSIHPNTPEKWIASMRDSLANLLALPENKKALRMREERCLQKPFAVWKSSDPNMSFSKMCQDYSQASPHLAYAAGLIDGEGCIRIQKQSNKQIYIVVVQLAMTVKADPIRQALIATFGGNSYAMEFKNKKWAKQWQWRISGEKACDLLSQILPFLVLKKKQAQLALNMNEMRKMDGWTKKTRAAAERMKQQMHELNMKGPDARNAEGGWYQTSPDLFGTWHLSSDPWPRSGMTRNGFVYELPIVGRTITGTDGGYLPTPAASDPQLERRAMHGEHYITETGTIRRKNENGTSSLLGLAGYVKYWPSPTAHNAKETAAPSEGMRNTPTLAHQPGGQLNPEWVEWLMGFPIGHTALKQSGTVKSRYKPQSPGNSLEASDGE
jgi:hypothetical protein